MEISKKMMDELFEKRNIIKKNLLSVENTIVFFQEECTHEHVSSTTGPNSTFKECHVCRKVTEE